MRIFICQLIWICFFHVSLTAAQPREYFLPEPTVQKYAVILAGAAAEAEYENKINSWAMHLQGILSTDFGYKPEQIILLMGRENPVDPKISGPNRGDVIKDKMRALKKALQPGDQVFFFLLGHGTSNTEAAKFVIYGPDITGADFASILDTFSAQDLIVVNTASSSFPFCTALSGPGRVIISATRSRAEKYNTIFARYFIAALQGHAGDRDKNQRISMWEAFGFAVKNVEKWYDDQNRIPTEHAVLDDNGDGFFSVNPDPVQGDGMLAQIAYLDLLPTKAASSRIAAGAEVDLMRDLNAKVRELERSVVLLRNHKGKLPPESYRKKMDTLLIELARTSRKLRDMNSEMEN